MRRKVWVTFDWSNPMQKHDWFTYSPDLVPIVELEGTVSPNSDLFMYFDEIWSQGIESARNHPWCKKGFRWHETKEEAEKYLINRPFPGQN